MGVFDFHGLELSSEFAAAQLELFDNIRNLLEPVDVSVRFPLTVRDDEECGSFEQQHFVSIYDVSEVLQVLFQCLDIGDESVDDGRPGFVESFVPDGGPETG